jgi:hypothetical protein
MSTPAPTAATPPPDTVSISGERLAHLENVNREYSVTVNTLAIVAEMLLEARGDAGGVLYIDADLRQGAPDLRAGVDAASGRIWIKVSR